MQLALDKNIRQCSAEKSAQETTLSACGVYRFVVLPNYVPESGTRPQATIWLLLVFIMS